jgi:hypothetical protein
MLNTGLGQIFAIVPSTVSRYISFTLKILTLALTEILESLIKWPAPEEFDELNALIVQRHPQLTGVFSSMDGLNLPLQESGDWEQ